MDDAEVWRGIFDAEYEKLQRESDRLAKIERTPDNFAELAAASARLDEQRRQSRKAHQKIVSRYEPPTPDTVNQPRGTQDTGRASKAMATLAALLLAVVAYMGFMTVRSYWSPYSVAIDGVANERVEPVDGRCLWSFDALVDNRYDEAIAVTGFEMVLNRASVRADAFEPVSVPAKLVAPVPVSFVLGDSDDGCPSPGGIDHGLATVTFSGAGAALASVTGRF